jgi:TetR/AcrR family transcriptional regulator
MHDRKSGQKEGTILDAARKRFAYYGYSKTTMDEIAGDVAMGKASLYYYFPTKESLFRAVIKAEQEEFIEHGESLIAAGGPAPEKLRAYVERRIKFFQRAVVLGKFNLQTYSEMKPIISDLMRDFARCEHRILTQILVAGSRDGEFMIDDPDEVSQTLLHVLQGLRLRIFNSGTELPPGENQFEELRHETGMAMKIFLRGIAAAPDHPSTILSRTKPRASL